ncbi:DivIVA domain-containing protein [Demequina sp. NBRC 110052]|uniref:DivIVA domain-containing protein n=1 Tax=Demequina sp. NBRC 110052 TaxID=1570341 RepID=UPI000A00B331|nr:DivIVA domain-containing protein [Demequina sp. NBRC 110052]
MALLTAEDVLNKAFSKTKYREGFDQDEVDDFLDEVAHTISVLTAERDDLAQRLAAAQAAGPAAAAPVAAAAPAPAGTEASSLLEAATDPNPPAATDMIAMAQKLQAEYVTAGEEEKERILEQARAKADEIVARAEGDAQARIDALASERSEVERKIDDLRRFERDYRARLKTYLENLLGDLDHGTVPTGVAASGPAFAAAVVESGDDAVAASEPVTDEAEDESVDEPVGEGYDAPAASWDAPSEEATQEATEEAVDEPAPATPSTPWATAVPAVPADEEPSFDESAEAGAEGEAVEESAAPEQPAWQGYQPRAFAPVAEESEPEAPAEEQPAPAPQPFAGFTPQPMAAEPEPEPQQEAAPETPASGGYQPQSFEAPQAPQAPQAPVRQSLQGFGAPAAQEPAAPAEPPTYTAPTPVTPSWAPTTGVTPTAAQPAVEEPEEKAEESEGQASPDIYDIRAIFGEVNPRDTDR